MKRIGPACLLFSSLLLARPATAQELSQQQKQAASQAVAALDEAISGLAEVPLPSRIYAITIAAQTYARAGQPERARAVLQEFLESLSRNQEDSQSTDESIRNRAASWISIALANMGYLADAAEIAAGVSDDTHWFAIANVASGYARKGDIATALSVAATISERSSRDQAYTMIASECGRRADFTCASAAVGAMADSPMKATMMGAVANSKARKGNRDEAAADLEQARDMAEGLPDSAQLSGRGSPLGCNPAKWPTSRDVALREVAESQVNLGDLQAARETLTGVQDPEVREHVLVVMARAATRQRNFTLALSVAGEVLRPECRAVALSSIAFTQFVTGDSPGALSTVNQIPTVYQRARTLMNIAGTPRARRVGIAASTLARASELALQSADPAERLSLLLEVARRQIAAGFKEQTRSTLLAAQAVDSASPENSSNVFELKPGENPAAQAHRNWNGLRLALAELISEIGDIPAAIEVARRTQNMNPTPTLARAATRGGHVETTRKWAASLPNAAERSGALIGIAIGILDRARIGRTPTGAVW